METLLFKWLSFLGLLLVLAIVELCWEFLTAPARTRMPKRG